MDPFPLWLPHPQVWGLTSGGWRTDSGLFIQAPVLSLARQTQSNWTSCLAACQISQSKCYSKRGERCMIFYDLGSEFIFWYLWAEAAIGLPRFKEIVYTLCHPIECLRIHLGVLKPSQTCKSYSQKKILKRECMCVCVSVYGCPPV